MDYKVDDEFLDSVDRLLDSVMEMSQHSDPMTASGIALVDLKRFEAVRDNAVRVCDLIEDGFPDVETKVRRTPKKAPVIVTMILIPYILIRMALDLVSWLTDAIAEGFQVLGPRFQGMVIGFFGGLALFIFALNLAIWG